MGWYFLWIVDGFWCVYLYGDFGVNFWWLENDWWVCFVDVVSYDLFFFIKEWFICNMDGLVDIFLKGDKGFGMLYIIDFLYFIM